MFVTILDIMAAIATVAGFLMEVWRTWKEYRADRPRADDAMKNKGDSANYRP